jgi:hypothetical protein
MGPGWAREADDEISLRLVGVNGRRGLTIAVKEVAGRDVDELKLCRIVMELDGDGSNVSSAIQHDGDLEGGA